MDPLTGMLFLIGLLGAQGGQSSPAPYVPPPPPPPPRPPSPGPVVSPIRPPSAPVAPPPVVVTPPPAAPAAPPWPAPVTPAGVPPYPDPSWIPDIPTAQAIYDRAAYWNPQLWDYPTKTIKRPFVTEQFGGRWVTFVAKWHPGNSGPQTFMATEAYRLASDPPMLNVPPPAPGQPASAAPPGAAAVVVQPSPGAAPVAVPTVPVQAIVAPPPPPVAPPQQPAVLVKPTPTAAPVLAPMAVPPNVSPYPGTGAYKSNAPYIGRYQAALTYLAQALGHPSWDPGGIDQKYGPKTSTAVSSFERDNSLGTPDGAAGPAVAARLDALLTAARAGGSA